MSNKNELKVYSEDNLAKSNILIQSKNKTTVLGNKLIALGLFHLQKGEYQMSANGGNIVCTLTAAEIRNRLNKSGNSLYRDLDATSKRLLNYQLGYKDPDKQEFRYINLFTEISYEGGEFSITFNGDMKQYISELKDNYTILNLPLMLKWQKTYTFRLFELLSSRTYLYRDQDYQCEAEFGLAELKFTIGCYDIEDERVKACLKDKQNPDYELAEVLLTENKKSVSKTSKTQLLKWFDFKRNVIDPAVEEINSTEEADMIIDDVEPLKKGRGGKVYGIIFKYRVNIKKDDKEENKDTKPEEYIMPLTEDEKFDIVAKIKTDILSRHKLPFSDIRAICVAADYDMDKIKRASNQLNLQHGKIENVTGWLISCIKNDYKATGYKSEKKVAGLNDYEQRAYNMDLLERQMLLAQEKEKIKHQIVTGDGNINELKEQLKKIEAEITENAGKIQNK